VVSEKTENGFLPVVCFCVYAQKAVEIHHMDCQRSGGERILHHIVGSDALTHIFSNKILIRI